MILTVGNIKGGVGKSTLACNTAVCCAAASMDVLLIDGDKQGSASDFAKARSDSLGETGFTCVRGQGKEIIGQVKTMHTKFDHIIIDAGGQDNPSLRAGLVSSDCVLVPVSPRSFETWALDSMVELIEEASIANPNLQPFVVLNLAFPRGQDNGQTANIISDDYPVLKLVKIQIVQRKVFSDSIGLGKSIFECKPQNSGANSELTGLLQEIGILNDINIV